MEIAMTYAAGEGADEYLARTRLVDFDLLDGQRLIDFAKNGSFDSHAASSSQEQCFV